MAEVEKLVMKRYDDTWEEGKSSSDDEYYTDNHRDADNKLRRARYRDVTVDDLTPYIPAREEHPYRDAIMYAALDAFEAAAIDLAHELSPYIARAISNAASNLYASAKAKISDAIKTLESPTLKADEILGKYQATQQPVEDMSLEVREPEASDNTRLKMSGNQARELFSDAVTRLHILSIADIEEDGGTAHTFDYQSQIAALEPSDIVASLNRLLASDSSLIDESLKTHLESLLGRRLYVEGSFIPFDEDSLRLLLPPDYWEDKG